MATVRSLVNRLPGARRMGNYVRLFCSLMKAKNRSSLVFAPPGHFYSPIPDLGEVKRKAPALFRRGAMSLPGVDLREDAQLALLDSLSRYYDEIPFGESANGDSRYHYRNGFFGNSDAIVLYAMLRHFRPKRVIEVGSGYSSAVMLDTNNRFLDDAVALTFIEPFPGRLRSIFTRDDEARHTVIESPVQDVPHELFTRLRAGDFLFVDSSHVVKTGSDVAHLIFNVLPDLAPGVFIHFHDIMWPFEYPEDWVFEGRAWNEAYVLRAFLQYNREFEIVYFTSFMGNCHADKLETRMPLCLENTGVSLWLRKVGSGAGMRDEG
jgi:hypothetical protein